MALLAASAPPRANPGRLWRGPGVLALLLAGALHLAAEPPASKEYQIKAAFLFNFAQFVDWPVGAFPGPDAPLKIGILGDDPFGMALERVTAGETIRHRRLVIVRSHNAADLAGCQLVFITKSEKGEVGGVLARLAAGPILTVSEIPGFARDGGMINFYLKDNKVRFEINPGSARHEGLKISSQLLGLGRIVDAGRGGG